MIWEKEVLKVLRTEFERKKNRNPRFSVRQYAARLGISIGALSEIFAEKRKISKGNAFRIFEQLELNESEKSRLLVLMGEKPSASLLATMAPETRAKIIEIFRDWRHLLILSVMSRQEESSLVGPLKKITRLSEQEIVAKTDEIKALVPSQSEYLSLYLEFLGATQGNFTPEELKSFKDCQDQLFAQTAESHQKNQVVSFHLPLCLSVAQYENLCEELRQLLYRYLDAGAGTSSDANQLFVVSLQALPLARE